MLKVGVFVLLMGRWARVSEGVEDAGLILVKGVLNFTSGYVKLVVLIRCIWFPG